MNLLGLRTLIRRDLFALSKFLVLSLIASVGKICQCRLFAGMKKFEYEGRKWHAECFQCDECHQVIRDQKFAPADERIVCVHCYEREYAPRCHNCNRVSNSCLHFASSTSRTDPCHETNLRHTTMKLNSTSGTTKCHTC